MRKLDPFKDYELPDKQKTDFTKEEMLDILDFYLQYKPCFENPDVDYDYLSMEVAHDFTLLLYEYQIMDFNFFENLDKMEEKYGKHDICDLSEEKLDFFEIMTLFTFVHRGELHNDSWYDSCVKDNTYYNLLCRLEEIREDLLKG